jgi:hypothetical protein
MLRHATAGVLLFVALAASACTRAKAPREPRVVQRYSTPQECFDAFVAAERDRDHQTYAECLSPQALKDAAAELALNYLSVRDLTFEEDEFAKEMVRVAEPVFEVMDRHGLTVSATRHVSRSDDPKQRERSRREVLELLDDALTFYVEARAAGDRAGGGEPTAAPKTTLSDVEIDGDHATGKVQRWVGEREPAPVPTAFVWIDGSWRIRP